MGTKLERISQLSRENPDMVFTSIGHLINKELLRECHEKMDGKKAVGIDGIMLMYGKERGIRRASGGEPGIVGRADKEQSL